MSITTFSEIPLRSVFDAQNPTSPGDTLRWLKGYNMCTSAHLYENTSMQWVDFPKDWPVRTVDLPDIEPMPEPVLTWPDLTVGEWFCFEGCAPACLRTHAGFVQPGGSVPRERVKRDDAVRRLSAAEAASHLLADAAVSSFCVERVGQQARMSLRGWPTTPFMSSGELIALAKKVLEAAVEIERDSGDQCPRG